MSHLPLWPRSPSSHEPFSPQSVEKASRLRGATVTEGVCPYCAVGLRPAHLHQGRASSSTSRATPSSPINEGTLCPKGANAFQLAVNPASRHPRAVSRPLLRPLGDAAARLGAGPDRPPRQGRARRRLHGPQRVTAACSTRCSSIGTLGGATLDNEENYLIKKLFGGGLGVVSIENQARI